MLKALVRSLSLIAGSVAVATAILACAIVAAVTVMLFGCWSAVVGPRSRVSVTLPLKFDFRKDA